MESERHSGATAHGLTTPKQVLPPDVREGDVRQQLERIRSSAPFRSSRRCLVFLDFVVHAAVDGRLESLKERTIGIEVFSRDPNYDTNQDPVVRGTASEVRKRLAQYYQLPGHERELRIDLPAGSYLPEFHWPAEILVPKPSEGAPEAVIMRAPVPWLKLATLAVLSGIVTAWIFVPHSLSKSPTLESQTIVDQLWAPILQSSGPVLLCVGQPKVYNLLGSLEAEISRRIPGPSQRPTAGGMNDRITVPIGDVVPNWDRYLALGDAMCLADLAGLLVQHGHEYHVRGGASTSFADLRENPSVLVGAFTNDWTMRLNQQLRFTFELEPDKNTHYVHDRLNPSNREWRLTNIWPDWKMPIDYAIVSRILDPTTGRVVVTAAGLTQYGTAAAGEFLTNPEYLSQLVRNAPRDWQHKNIQAVLATKVIDGTAGPPQVLATHFW